MNFFFQICILYNFIIGKCLSSKIILKAIIVASLNLHILINHAQSTKSRKYATTNNGNDITTCKILLY